MAAYEYLLVDLITLIYNLAWLVFLTHKHYGQVTTTAGHIFELNVLLNININIFFSIIIVDLEVFPWGIISEIPDINVQYSHLVAVAGSQLETAIFLKTLNVNTMMTNTAGKIILAMYMFCYILGVIITLVYPSTRVKLKSEILFCEYLNTRDFYCFMIPVTVLVAIVLSVIGFSVFRVLQIKRIRSDEELAHDTGVRRGTDTPPQGRLFSVQAVISELNQVLPRVEEDLVIQDIEDDNMNNMSELSDNQHNNQDINQPNQSGCVPVLLPGINMIMKTIEKYMKNTMISLVILTSQLLFSLPAWYGFITSSGCEDSTIKAMAEMSEYGWYMLTIFTPLLIKLKLDRLSE